LLQVTFTPEWAKMMKDELDNYFDDKTFQQACSRLIAETETYGKLPTVHQFVKYSPVKGVDKKVEKKQEFLNKVASFLELDYVMDYDRRKFDNISELEYRTLQSLGGLSELYARVHNIDYPTNVATIIRQLSDFYDNNFDAESSKIASNRRLFLERGASIPDELTDNWSNGLERLLGVSHGS
jgi:predicted translin family RNA/ssDNA-binding protein